METRLYINGDQTLYLMETRLYIMETRLYINGDQTLFNGDQTLYLLTATLINYTIWQWRLKKLIPSIASVKNDVDFLFECIADASKTIKNLAINSGIPICRRWRAGRYGRG